MAKARAAKAAKKQEVVDETTISASEVMAAMAKQIAALQSAVLEQGKQRFEKQEATLEPIPPASEELRPGTYIQQGIDAAGAPIMGKVRWTKQWIEKTYEPVTFVPRRNMVVGPHGISYTLVGGETNTVPGICKDIYDAVIKQEAEQNLRYRPIAPDEAYDLASRAAQAPGKHWSRPYLAGRGLNVRTEESAPEAAPAAAAPETPAK